ncbi:hypothetical protein PVAP13_7KG294550 [Panicum virgatum]|uniref:Uncharacterized protein n=1 Tax=Panicum virgatum TaxID=38727 RepID=A0A8T0QP55_PANVG|nr:hypothetical protein PVAP13_7KG294550 [Panicum virgatum]
MLHQLQSAASWLESDTTGSLPRVPPPNEPGRNKNNASRRLVCPRRHTIIGSVLRGQALCMRITSLEPAGAAVGTEQARLAQPGSWRRSGQQGRGRCYCWHCAATQVPNRPQDSKNGHGGAIAAGDGGCGHCSATSSAVMQLGGTIAVRDPFGFTKIPLTVFPTHAPRRLRPPPGDGQHVRPWARARDGQHAAPLGPCVPGLRRRPARRAPARVSPSSPAFARSRGPCSGLVNGTAARGKGHRGTAARPAGGGAARHGSQRGRAVPVRSGRVSAASGQRRRSRVPGTALANAPS